jgi:uncharacterized protein (TIGR03000 family)
LSLAVIVGSVGTASAGWGWGGGSSGGSSGGWGGSSGGWGYGGSSGGYGFGSSGGSSGGWGSSGGYGSSGGGRHHGLFHHHRRAWGSSGGGWGSSGGSSGGWGSSGGYGSSGGFDYGGSSGGFGSSGGYGGGAYYAPSVVVPDAGAPMDAPLDNPPANAPAGDAPAPRDPMNPADAGRGASRSSVDGTLVVEVPADAKIYVNDRLTSTPGEVREYVSRNLKPGYNYSYEVRAEVVRNGEKLVETKHVDLRAGQSNRLAFSFAGNDEVETSITVRVPAGAKVNLGGNDTQGSGETRVFRTSALRPGSQWSDYKVVATIEIDGHVVTKEQSIDLAAGDNKEVTFDFDTASVASR